MDVQVFFLVIPVTKLSKFLGDRLEFLPSAFIYRMTSLRPIVGHNKEHFCEFTCINVKVVFCQEYWYFLVDFKTWAWLNGLGSGLGSILTLSSNRNRVSSDEKSEKIRHWPSIWPQCLAVCSHKPQMATVIRARCWTKLFSWGFGQG